MFISRRHPQSVIQEDLELENLSILRVIATEVDFANQQVIASCFGLGKRTAVYRHGLGCSLVYGDQVCETIATGMALDAGIPRHDGMLGQNADSRLNAELDWAFAEPDLKYQRRTRAVVILHQGKLVAERYAPGFGPDMPLSGWSMAKGVINALVGILVGLGKLELDAPAPVPEWQGMGDPRREIILGQLLQMTSGLAFTEKSRNPVYDLTHMLLATPDSAAYAANKPLRHQPGTHWNYASGTSNIISRLIRDTLGDTAYRQFPRLALFEPLGMDSACLEADASGTLVGSSFLYATARDWAKFGQLYLQDGIWAGKRILPEGWVGYSAAATPESKGRYGAHFWLDIQHNLRDKASAQAFFASRCLPCAGLRGAMC